MLVLLFQKLSSASVLSLTLPYLMYVLKTISGIQVADLICLSVISGGGGWLVFQFINWRLNSLMFSVNLVPVIKYPTDDLSCVIVEK